MFHFLLYTAFYACNLDHNNGLLGNKFNQTKQLFIHDNLSEIYNMQLSLLTVKQLINVVTLLQNRSEAHNSQHDVTTSNELLKFYQKL